MYSAEGIKKLLANGSIVLRPKPTILDDSILVHISSRVVLKPGEFTTAKTKESVKLTKGIVGLYDGYTHLARKGVTTHMGSMLVKSDVDGQLILEIFNASKKEIVLSDGERVGQLIFLQVVD